MLLVIRISSPHVANDPTVWSNPEEFDPSRFAPGGEGTTNSKMQFEFGFGTRLCMGKSAFTSRVHGKECVRSLLAFANAPSFVCI